jgi:hypothetical protein
MLPISEEDPGLAGLSVAPEAVREPGPPRCACGYLLGGLVEKGGLVRCPECGKEQGEDGCDRRPDMWGGVPRPVVALFLALMVLGAVVTFQRAYLAQPQVALGGFAAGMILGAPRPLYAALMRRRPRTRLLLRSLKKPQHVRVIFLMMVLTATLVPYGFVFYWGALCGWLSGCAPHLVLVFRDRASARHGA